MVHVNNRYILILFLPAWRPFRARLLFGRKRPILISDTLRGDGLLGYLHSKTDHQGPKIAITAIREDEFCPIGGSSRIGRIISTCVPCRIVRAPVMWQKMADLPKQFLYHTPTFYHYGIYVFGNFFISHGKARCRYFCSLFSIPEPTIGKS